MAMTNRINDTLPNMIFPYELKTGPFANPWQMMMNIGKPINA
ncbi:hypothetical protein CAter282_3113 [Collimonas arenae]|uniref:Uncharacterized protein n=1 Tax=Collimonas arenae TaxID=279058 RepID=A0A127PT36_9BURK|nr:hypothetical protein CAter10_3415 [Collimonas arenae]AMP10819.1 hypothetical protein CAter282_3113 [Collimonas arenae]